MDDITERMLAMDEQLHLDERANLMRLTLPRKYTQDAMERDLDIGTVIQWNKHTIVFDCTREQIAELHSDATYYSDVTGMDFADKHAIAKSARATSVAIKKAFKLRYAAFV